MPKPSDPLDLPLTVDELSGIRKGDTVTLAANPNGSTITAQVKSLHPERGAIVVKLDGSTVYLLMPVQFVLSIVRHQE